MRLRVQRNCAAPLRLRATASCAAVLIVAAALSGCGRRLPKADFTFVSASPHNQFDPQKMSWMMDIRLADCLFEPLVHYDFTAKKVMPGVAKSWDRSKDKLTYTFHLRDDAKWSNGQPVVAKDFIYAWRRALLPDNAAQYSQLLFTIKGGKAFFDWRTDQTDAFAAKLKKSKLTGEALAQHMWTSAKARFAKMVGVDAPDPHTLVVHLARPVPYFMSLVAFITFAPVYPPSVEKAMTLDPSSGLRRCDESYWSDPHRLVCDGPYVLSQRVFKQYTLLKANPHYWAHAAMRNHSILERIIVDAGNALLTYQNGGADWLPDIPTASPLAANLVAQHRPDVHTRAMAGTYFYDFNCMAKLPNGKPNPLADERVRRALSMAIDRKKIVDRVTRLHQPIAKSYIPPGVIAGYKAQVQDAVLYDPAAARKLLAEAGYPDGKALNGLSILYNTGQGHQNIAQAVQNMWETQLGVHVTLQGIEGKAFSDRLKHHDFTIARASWFGDYPDPVSFLGKLVTGDGNNDCGWSNAQFDALLQQAKGMADEKKRMSVLEHAADLIQRQQPMALIFQYVFINVYDPKHVQGLNPNAWARWRLENVRVR